MKPVTEQMLAEHHNATVRGVIEGFIVSGSIMGAGSYYLQKRWASYRALPTSAKTLLFVSVVLPVMTLQGERRGTAFDKTTWEGEKGISLITPNKDELNDKWRKMTTTAKIGDWASRHEYTLIMGAWASSLGLSGAIISRNKFQTFAQKIVQARMWAQGLTVGILVVAGALQGAKRRKSVETRHIDHSWQGILDEQDNREKKIPLAPVTL